MVGTTHDSHGMGTGKAGRRHSFDVATMAESDEQQADPRAAA